jgi:hypothetical protein
LFKGAVCNINCTIILFVIQWQNYYDIIRFMATGESDIYDLPFPLAEDSVNVHGDIRQLVEKLEAILPSFGVGYFQLLVINGSAIEDLPAGTPVYATGYTTKTVVSKATPGTTSPILGLLKQPLSAGSEGVAVVAGVLDGINTSSFSDGDVIYVSESGGLTNIRPENGSAAVGIVAHSAADGIIIVEAKGNGTWGALRDGLS